MSDTRRDEDFCRDPIVRNQDCRAVDRYLKRVPEQVIITGVCQDPNTPSLVIIDFTLMGSFYFEPSCKIRKVDDEDYDVFAQRVDSHFRSMETPINSACQTVNGQLVFDFGDKIPEYIQAQVIEFDLIMVGSVPASYGVTFPSQTVSDSYRWEKGALPRPFSMDYVNGVIGVVFDYAGGRDCSCNIQCVAPSGVSNNVIYCQDEAQRYEIQYGALNGDPQYIQILLRDSLNNESEIYIQSLMGVNVKPLILKKETDSLRVEISIIREASNGDKLEDVSYQILRAEGNTANYTVWKNWSSRDWSHFVDYDVSPGRTYSYKVRFKDKMGNTSNFSSWKSVTL